MSLKVVAVVLFISSCVASQNYKSLKTVLEWKSLEYGFPTDNERQYAIDNGLYGQNAGAPIDIAVEYKSNGKMRIFRTIPRFGSGVPYTLATVTKRSAQNGPILEPYPNYNWHNANNVGCQGIISAFRVVIDECNHMWVIDSGVADGVQMCPPQLLTFDLKTDHLISRYVFGPQLYTQAESLFITPAVDIRDPPPFGSCHKAMVYIADVSRPGLVVYSSEQNLAWRIEDESMFPRSEWGTHTIAGTTFDLMDGIFALSISPRDQRDRFLFFHALADDREFAVRLRYIDSSASSFNRRKSNEFNLLGRRNVQSAMEAIDSKGNIFASTNDPLTIFAWNIKRPYNQRTFMVVANNPDQLQFVSGMKVVKHPHGYEELWVATVRYQRIATGTMDFNEVNFRVMVCKTEDLLKNARCTDTEHQDLSNAISDSTDRAPNFRHNTFTSLHHNHQHTPSFHQHDRNHWFNGK